MSIPGKYFLVDGSVEDTIMRGWPKGNDVPRVIVLRYNAGEVKVQTDKYPTAASLIDDIGQIEANHKFALKKGRWTTFIVPPKA